MNSKRAIGVLVVLSAILIAASLVMPSMTLDAQAQQCSTAASSGSGTAESEAFAFEGFCDAFSRASPPEDDYNNKNND
jgi:hypothetical protein